MSCPTPPIPPPPPLALSPTAPLPLSPPTAGNIPGSHFKKPYICPADHVLDLEGGWFPDRSKQGWGPNVSELLRPTMGWGAMMGALLKL